MISGETSDEYVCSLMLYVLYSAEGTIRLALQ